LKVLVLRNITTPIIDILKQDGDDVIDTSEQLDEYYFEKKEDYFIVSHGYRHIINHQVLNIIKDRIINLHISYLPWNRGADPNLWSFLENTPKGVSIHYIDEGIDTGDIIVQKKLVFNEEKETLLSTYQKLQDEIIHLFKTNWPLIKNNNCRRMKQPVGGSFHKSSDRKKFEHLLIKGWDTTVIGLRGKAISRDY